jgi:hypothetical protein
LVEEKWCLLLRRQEKGCPGFRVSFFQEWGYNNNNNNNRRRRRTQVVVCVYGCDYGI